MRPRLRLVSARPLLANPIRIVAVDLDDTLFDDNQTLSVRGAKAIEALRRLGTAVIPATSRGVLSFNEVRGAADFGPFAVLSGGAVTIDLLRNEVVSLRILDLPLALSLIADIRRITPDISVAVETTTRFFGENWIMTHTGLRGTEELVGDVAMGLAEPPLKLLLAHPGGLNNSIIEAIQQSVADRADVMRKPGPWVEVIAAGTDKVVGLKEVVSLMGADSDQVLCVGDEENDVEMLRWAGTAAVVANATSRATEQADLLLPSNAEDGASLLLERLAEAQLRPDRIEL